MKEDKKEVRYHYTGKYDDNKLISSTAYHLFADANIADGRGGTVIGQARCDIITWLRLLPANYRQLLDMVEKEWREEDKLTTLFECLPTTRDIDIEIFNKAFQEYNASNRNDTAEMDTLWGKVQVRIRELNLDALNREFWDTIPSPSEEFDIALLLVDITAYKVRNVLRSMKYPLFLNLGTRRHAIGYYIISETKLMLTNSGDGLAMHGPRNCRCAPRKQKPDKH